MNPIGYRILPRSAPAVSPEVLAGFAAIGSAQISDCMNRLYGVDWAPPLHAGTSARSVWRSPSRLVRAIT